MDVIPLCYHLQIGIAQQLVYFVQLFLEETDEVTKKITGGLADQAIESALHFLKGSALNLGFRKLAALCQTGEKAAANGQFDKIDLAQVVTLYQASKAAFQSEQNAENAA